LTVGPHKGDNLQEVCHLAGDVSQKLTAGNPGIGRIHGKADRKAGNDRGHKVTLDLANENFPSDLEYISGKYMHENCDNNEDSKTSVKLQPIFDLILFSKQCDQHHQEDNEPRDWAGVDSENGD